MNRLSDNLVLQEKDKAVISQIKQEGIDEYKISLNLAHQISSSRLHDSLITELETKYDQAIITSLHIVKPDLRVHPLMPHSVIDDSLKRLAKSMALTLLKNEMGLDSISNYIKNDNYKMYYDYISEKIAYGVLMTISPFILGMLSYYVNELYIFHYIRDNIVRPDILNLIELTRNTVQEGLSKTHDIEQENKVSDAINLFILSILVTMDTKDAGRAINTLSECKLDPDFVNRVINKSEYAVPKFVKDIILPVDTLKSQQARETMVQFLTEYSRTFSMEMTSKLLRKYTETSLNITDKILFTIKERNKLNATGVKTLIDGFTLEENEVLSRLIVFNSISDDQVKLINDNKYLRNIKSIIEANKTADMKITVTNDMITIESSIHEPRSFYYKQDDIQMYLQDPFNIFGSSKEYVKTLYTEKDLKCSLFQTAMTKKEDKSRLYAKDSYLNLDTPEKRIVDRNNRIQRLLNSLANSNPEQVAIANELISGRIPKIRYMNPRQSDNYRVDNPVKMLLILAETEGLYRKITQVNEIKEKEEQEKAKKLELSKNNVLQNKTNKDIKEAMKAIKETHNTITEYTKNEPLLKDPRKSKTLY